MKYNAREGRGRPAATDVRLASLQPDRARPEPCGEIPDGKLKSPRVKREEETQTFTLELEGQK